MRAVDPSRNVELDIIKGGLVCIMLLYHCASVSAFPVLRVVTDYFQFIHFAFLVITGFLCGYHYFAASQTSPSKVAQRLLIRAWKVFAIFLFANVVYHCLGYGRMGWERLRAVHGPMAVVNEFLNKLPGDFIAYEILYLISAFLLVASVLVLFNNAKWLLGIIVLLTTCVPGRAMLFIAFGCSGMLFGILVQEGCLTFLASWIRKYRWIFPILLILNLVFISLPSTWPLGNGGKLAFYLLQTVIWFYSFI